jgi:fatty-acyl-CoA synthase
MRAGAPGLTVADTLARAAATWPDATAIMLGSARLTYRDVLARGLEFAAALAGAGLGRGDHVGLLLPNCLEYLLLFYGCALGGFRPVHLNARYRDADLAYVIPDSDMRVLITSARSPEHADYPSMLTTLYPELETWNGRDALSLAAAPRLERVYCLHSGEGLAWPGLPQLLAGSTGEPVALEADPGQIALIMYTSGTTAHPKACLLSHRALETAGRGLAARFRMTGADRFWDPLPFFHMSTMLPLAACRATGAAFIGVEHFEPGPAAREILAERATILYPSFPTIANALFAHPEFDSTKLDCVRLVNNVGPPDLLRRYAAVLPRAVHVSAYGLTEAGGVISFNDPDDTPEQLAETCGAPFEGIEVRIVDPETQAALPTGQRGEIQIRGPTLFSGYYRDEQKTREAFTPDGWFRSGDLGALADGGRIRYLGRIKDMLKVGGENVAAIEIESHLCTHPAIRVAQVIGVPDERLQEVPAAFIECEPGVALEPLDVVKHCLGRIASFKVPRYVYFVDEWPLSATKIQKFRLRDRVRAADRINLAQVRRG